jgi:glycosyltransferase involved in cell wall biosynthesis
MTTFTTEDRMEAERKPRIMVITPTTGKNTLLKAIESVRNQTIKTEHLVVVDGNGDIYTRFANMLLNKISPNYDNPLQFIPLPENVGGNGWYGHRVYAAMPLLVNADYILFLDEDNWFEPNHVETMINKIKSKDLMWAYSLRRICDESGQYVCDDDCESLGRYPTFYDHALNFVDTNCYCFRREYLVTVAHSFYGQWGADRPFYKSASTALPAFGCTGEATVNYRAPERLLKMFREGNKVMKDAYKPLPWRLK